MRKPKVTPSPSRIPGILRLPVLHLVAVALVAGTIGYHLHKDQPIDTPHEAVWIEFENLQHAIDAASKLGGKKRGLSVCMQKKEEEPITLWNPGIDVSGDLRRCGYRKPDSRVAMEITPNASADLTGMVFSNLLDGTSVTMSWTIGGAIHGSGGL